MIETKGFLHITIGVTDLELATEFYQTVLGCEIINRNPIMTFMKTGNDLFVLTKTGMHASPNPDGAPGPGKVLFHHAMLIAPEAYDGVLATFRERGIAYYECGLNHETFPGRRHVYIKDPDGNSIELATELIQERT